LGKKGKIEGPGLFETACPLLSMRGAEKNEEKGSK